MTTAIKIIKKKKIIVNLSALNLQAGDEREAEVNELIASTQKKKVVLDATNSATSLMAEGEALVAENKFKEAQAKYTAAAKQWGIAHDQEKVAEAQRLAADAGTKDEFRHLQG